MNWLDRFIGWISPEMGAKREAWRQNLESMRNYDAGNRGRLNANWNVINQSAEHTDRYSRESVRARARDLERNSDIMNAIIGAFKRNVVGGGYRLQARTPNDKINKELEKYWKIWCKKQNCDVTATQSFSQIIRMAVVRKKIDGGILFVKRYTTGGLLPFKLQMFEVDELDSSNMVPHSKENRVCGGIEYTPYNRPVGYWIKQYELDGYGMNDPIYIDAKDVIFYFTKRRPSQVREMSDMSQTITRIRDVNEFMVAVSVKERIAACLSVFIKRTIPTTGMGRGVQQATKQVDYEGKTISPGMIKELNAGDEIQVVNPTGQAADATSFTKVQQRLIGAGQGISYEAMSRDMSETNYASARQGLIEDGLTYDDERELLLEVMDEIYETFVISAVLAGLISISDFWDKKDEYMAHNWIQAPKQWIDPAKEAAADKTALQTGQKTFQQIAAENGRDWKDQVNDMAAVLEYGREKGIELGGVIFGRDKSQIYPEAEKQKTKDLSDDGKEMDGAENNGNKPRGGTDEEE
ncbi:MAG: phage portal protein [Lachnospiraceae bacterium]|nr:phage portal protein [Lachnospiraceae bacterium]